MNNNVETLVAKTKKLWKSTVVNNNKKLNTKMKKLVSKVKKHGINLNGFKKLKFDEYKGSDVDSLVKTIRMCSNPLVRCLPYSVKTVKESIKSEVSLMFEYYNKRITFLSALLVVVDST